MSIEVIADKAVQEVLTRLLEKIGIEDIILVHAETASSRMRLAGLDVALTKVNDGRPILVQTFLDLDRGMLIMDERYHALRGYPNVGFARLPASATELAGAIEKIANQTRPIDPLAIALLGVKDPEETLIILKHDLGHAEKPGDPAKIAEILVRARKAGLVDDDETTLKLIRMAITTSLQPFAGQQFPDVFCDIEGTLLINGQLNDQVVAYLREQAKTRPITLWTGGDVKAYRQQLSKLLPWKVVSKWLFSGVSVETVVDDQSQDRLEETYGLKIAQHISAASLSSK